MQKGLVSIIMGVHNEKEEHLRLAIKSIFQQSYQDIELIIIDDASNEDCKFVLDCLCERKKSVTIVHNEANLGLTKSLNIGIKLAKGEFVARMDADDFSVSNRIEKQVDYFNSHQDIDLIGTGVVSFGDRHIYMSPAFGLSNKDAKVMLFFSSTLCHPSVMIRKDFLDWHHLSYDEKVLKAQDYDLWERSSVYGNLAVMKDVLLYYRIHANQITSKKNKEQVAAADVIRKRRLGRLGITPSDREYLCHELLSSGVDATVTMTEMESWVNKILKGNEEKHLVDSNCLRNNMKTRLLFYKLRNKKMIRWEDLSLLINVFISRLKIKVKLAKHKRIIRQLGIN
ncbi:MAG: glycosyltransferase [Prevotella sp.]|nr:glycosyltransferase [Prevotella sp.]